MRLSTDDDRAEEQSLATIAAAVEVGITVFDTARAYGRDDAELGHNERLLATALRQVGPPAAETARIVTKGGMTRLSGAWVPDGRAKAIRQDCEASLAALDGFAIDLYLLHAPDPRTSWATSVRALARLVDDGLVRRVGLSNVRRSQLDQALDLAPIAAVEVAVSVFDDTSIRGGVIERCDERGLAVIAHSPLGGPQRAGRIGRQAALTQVANRHHWPDAWAGGATPADTGGPDGHQWPDRTAAVSPAEVALAWLLTLSPNVVAIPGARRPESARSAARAASVELDPDDRDQLDREYGRPRHPATRPAQSTRSTSDTTNQPAGADGEVGGEVVGEVEGEVVMIMGVPGAGKSRTARDLVAQGYARLNRDEQGGSLRQLASALESTLAAGVHRVVLDNTYLTRAARSHVIDAARRHHLPVRCLWLDTTLAQAQVNLVHRLIDQFGRLPTPEELAALGRREPGALTPTAQMRARRQLEPPSPDEGFTAVEQVPFGRVAPPEPGLPGLLVAAAAIGRPGWEAAVTGVGLPAAAPVLVFDWQPDDTPTSTPDGLIRAGEQLQALLGGRVEMARVEIALCPHPAGPPICWCRPPLPGLAVAFARAHGVDLGRSVVVGTGPAHRTLAGALGADPVIL